MMPLLWKLLHPVQWREGVRYRRTYGIGSYSPAELRRLHAEGAAHSGAAVRYRRTADGHFVRVSPDGDEDD